MKVHHVHENVNKTVEYIKFAGVILGILILGGLVWFARPGLQNNQQPSPRNDSVLNVEEGGAYDFGSISMASGNVSHKFKIKNTGSDAVVINKAYTSCMCTTATLTLKDKQFGPYGMPGHGTIPKINQTIAPNEEATVEIVFDPAAHGPAGVGRIQRVVTIENDAGQPLELSFTAVVTP